MSGESPVKAEASSLSPPGPFESAVSWACSKPEIASTSLPEIPAPVSVSVVLVRAKLDVARLDEHVVAGAADQGVGARAAGDHVVARPAVEQVVAVAADQRIVAGPPEQRDGAGEAAGVHQVVAGAAGQLRGLDVLELVVDRLRPVWSRWRSRRRPDRRRSPSARGGSCPRGCPRKGSPTGRPAGPAAPGRCPCRCSGARPAATAQPGRWRPRRSARSCGRRR